MDLNFLFHSYYHNLIILNLPCLSALFMLTITEGSSQNTICIKSFCLRNLYRHSSVYSIKTTRFSKISLIQPQVTNDHYYVPSTLIRLLSLFFPNLLSSLPQGALHHLAIPFSISLFSTCLECSPIHKGSQVLPNRKHAATVRKCGFQPWF